MFHPYLLGWLYSTKCAISTPMICIRTYQEHLVTLLKSYLDHDELELYQHRNYIKIISSTFCEKILELLNPELFNNLNHTEKIEFIRGIFDAENTTIINTNFPKCIFISPISIKDIYYFISRLNIQCVCVNKSMIVFTGTHCVDFLGLLYNKTKLYSPNKYIEYLRLLDVQHQEIPKCIAYKTDSEAIIPYKDRQSQIGYDLTCIKLAKRAGHIYVYDTGIKITIDHYNYFAQINFKHTDFLLIGENIIEPNEPILVNLLKINPSAPDLKLPFVCQLIFRKKTHVQVCLP